MEGEKKEKKVKKHPKDKGCFILERMNVTCILYLIDIDKEKNDWMS